MEFKDLNLLGGKQPSYKKFIEDNTMELVKREQSLDDFKKEEFDKASNEIKFHEAYAQVLKTYAVKIEMAVTRDEIDAAVEWFEENEPELDKYVIDDILNRKD